MKNLKALLLTRTDLKVKQMEADISIISIYDFNFEEEKLIWEHELIIFVDENGGTKILKSRYGRNGIVKCKNGAFKNHGSCIPEGTFVCSAGVRNEE